MYRLVRMRVPRDVLGNGGTHEGMAWVGLNPVDGHDAQYVFVAQFGRAEEARAVAFDECDFADDDGFIIFVHARGRGDRGRVTVGVLALLLWGSARRIMVIRT
jgi:hypothetical protein